MKSAYRDALVQGASAMGLAVDDALVEAMGVHDELLSKWASKMNLTAIRDPVESAILHGLDSLLFAELVAAGDRSRTVDVGSGAGFPGIVLALARPSLQMTLLEPAKKRASFLRVALAELRRPDVAVVEGRLEPKGAVDRAPWPASLIVSRAAIPPLELLASSPPYLAPRGRIIISGGQNAPERAELGRLAVSLGLAHLERRSFLLPTGERRILDVFERV